MRRQMTQNACIGCRKKRTKVCTYRGTLATPCCRLVRGTYYTVVVRVHTTGNELLMDIRVALCLSPTNLQRFA